MRKGLLVALAFILAANAATLATVALNRRGEEATLVLTERELRLSSADLENTGLALSLTWRRPPDVAEEDLPLFDWFDRARLEAVGFDCSVALDDPAAETHYRRQAFVPRAAYVVLEYRPDAVPGIVRDTGVPSGTSRGVRPLTDEDRTRLSRLAPVEVGLDPAALRARYPDRRRFVVLGGVVRLLYRPPARRTSDIGLDPRSSPAPGQPASDTASAPPLSPQSSSLSPVHPSPTLSGAVSVVFPSEISVPKAHRALLERLREEDVGAGSPVERLTRDPRYEVTLTWGRGLEPWVVKVERTE